MPFLALYDGDGQRKLRYTGSQDYVSPSPWRDDSSLERWAFWATLGIWIATPLPVFMYLCPSWPHTPLRFRERPLPLVLASNARLKNTSFNGCCSACSAA